MVDGTDFPKTAPAFAGHICSEGLVAFTAPNKSFAGFSLRTDEFQKASR